MKANELRLGNLIEVYLEPQISEWLDIKVNLSNLEQIINKDKAFRPIPLTEEWMLKLGFEYLDAFSWLKNGLTLDNTVAHFSFDIWRGTYSIENCDFNELPMEVKYVHTLQNLYFALTGEELQITNDTKNS